MDQQPSVGRIVHYVDEERGACRAAIITEIVAEPTVSYAGRVHLTEFGPHGTCPRRDVDGQREATKFAGTWHWPERT
jgi:hypothetical protein